MVTAPDGRIILEISNGWKDNHAHLDLLVDALIAHGNRVKRGWAHNRDGSVIRMKKRIDWELLNQLFVIPDEIVYEDKDKYNSIWCKRTYNEIWGGL